MSDDALVKEDDAYEIGDAAWIHTGGAGRPDGESGNPLVRGTVVHAFRLYGFMNYVIEIPTHIDPVLFVREADTMARNATGPIGFWKRLAAMGDVPRLT